MPLLFVTSNKKQATRNKVSKTCHVSRVTCHFKVKHGFTLIEILISLLLILAIIVVLFATSGTFMSSRKSNLQGFAAKIASCEIEQLRKTAFASLPASGAIGAPCNSDLAKLPQAAAERTVSDYQTDSDIKQIIISVTWVENNASQEIKMDTLISKDGL